MAMAVAMSTVQDAVKLPIIDLTAPDRLSTAASIFQECSEKVVALIALALNLDEKFFEDVGALDSPLAFLRLLHYPDDINDSKEEVIGSSAHCDYGMITLLATDGVPGLQVCRKKDNQPRVWENVDHMDGVIRIGQERYSVAFFTNPPGDLVVECLQSCCSESNPPRFPHVRAMDYLQERARLTYGSSN